MATGKINVANVQCKINELNKTFECCNSLRDSLQRMIDEDEAFKQSIATLNRIAGCDIFSVLSVARNTSHAVANYLSEKIGYSEIDNPGIFW